MSDEDLKYEQGAAEECAKACDDLAEGLEDDIQKLQPLVNVSGFGGFHTGEQLEAGFRRKALLAMDHFRAHQKIARNMAANFRTIGASYDQTEDANSEALKNAGAGMPNVGNSQG